MKLKHLVIAVAVLAVLSLVTFLAQRPAPPPSADPRIGQPFAATATLEQAAKVRIADQGKTVLLAKAADGTWRVPGYYDLPADFAKLSRFVSDLTEARLQRLVTTSPERIARLEFKDTQIAFLDPADKELWAVTLGRNAENGGRFARFGSEPKAWLTNLNTDLDATAKDWADSQLLNLKADDIAAAEFSFPDDSPKAVTVRRSKKEDAFSAATAPAGQELKGEAMTNALASFTNLRFSDTADLADPNAVAARAHARTIKLTLFDGKTLAIALGRKPEEKIMKAPAPSADAARNGPAAVLDPAKDAGPARTLEGTTETLPAGPVFVFITHSDANAAVNGLMQKRAFQVSDYTLTSLPQKPDEFFQPAPSAAPGPAPANPAESKTP